MTLGTYGHTSNKPLAFFDRVSSSWKTWPHTSGEGLTGSAPIWPNSGMTRHGRLSALPTSARPTSDGDCSHLRLLPTPQARDGDQRGASNPVRRRAQGRQVSLPDAVNTVVKLLPTPRATDGEKGGPNQRGSSGDPMLPTVVNRLTGGNTNRLSAGGNAT